MVHAELLVAVLTPIVPRGREPRLADRVRIREDVVIGLLDRHRQASLADPPARRHHMTRVVGDDPIVHRDEVAEGARRRHVVQNPRPGGGTVGILGVERGLDGLRAAELTAARPRGSGANLTAARGEGWESPLAAETRVVAVLPCEGTRDHDGLPCSIVARTIVVEGGDIVWAQVATIAPESSVGFRRYLHVRMHLVE